MTVASPAEGDLPGWVSSTGARHLPWRASRSPGPSLPGEVFRLRRLLAEVDPDVVHLHSAKAGLAGRLALRGGRPTIFQPHAWSFLAAGGPIGAGALRWERRAARWADRILCVSEDERLQGAEAGVDGRWAVIPNGVDLQRIRPQSRSEAREQLGLGRDLLVVCVGRLSRQKGQDVLLRGWPLVRTEVPEARLVLVGNGPDETALRRAAPAGVSFAGVSDDVPAWLAAADVVALPSRWEGMSLSMLEAMSAGRSLVMTDVPGARDALADGVGGIVPPEDPAALARALVERLRDEELREREGRAARARAEERFDLEVTLRATTELASEISRSSKPGETPGSG